MRRLLLIVAMLASPVTAQEDTPEAPPRPVVSEVVAPKSGLASSWVGSVAAASEIDLGFLRLGTLAERVADIGDTVAKGDILARLDASNLEAQLRAAEAGVSIAEASLQTARDAYDRVQALVQRGVNSEVAAQDTANDLAAAEAALEQARATAARAADARTDADLRAPIDGVVTGVSAEPGATLDAGEPVLRLAATEGREVIIALSEEDAGSIAPDARFEVRLLSNPEVTATAILARIDPVTTRATRTRSAHLTLAPDASDGFRLGALVTATLALDAGAITTLPLTALIDGSDPPAVWRVDPGDRTVARTAVTTGPQAGGRILILAGVSNGDEIVTRGVNSVKDGQPVGPRIPAGNLPGVGQ